MLLLNQRTKVWLSKRGSFFTVSVLSFVPLVYYYYFSAFVTFTNFCGKPSCNMKYLKYPTYPCANWQFFELLWSTAKIGIHVLTYLADFYLSLLVELHSCGQQIRVSLSFLDSCQSGFFLLHHFHIMSNRGKKRKKVLIYV